MTTKESKYERPELRRLTEEEAAELLGCEVSELKQYFKKPFSFLGVDGSSVQLFSKKKD